MAQPSHSSNAVSQDTLITIKVSVNDSLKKLKLPLKDLGAGVLPDKVCYARLDALPISPPHFEHTVTGTVCHDVTGKANTHHSSVTA